MKKGSPTDFTQSLFDNGEFYKVIKTKMGEMIWCMLRSDVQNISSVPYVTLVRPVLASQVKELRQQNDPNVLSETYAIRPWMGMSSSEEFVVGTEIFMTIGELSEKGTEQYKEYLIKAKMIDEAQKIVEDQRAKDAAIDALLLSLSTNGEVTFTTDGEP